MTGAAGVVVAHGPDPFLDDCLADLAPQVDDLVVVANIAGWPASVPRGARLITNERPVGFAANANAGIAATVAPYVALVNPDTVVRPGAVAALVEFAETTPSCGIAGARLEYPDGRWQPSRRRFPTVGGTLVRRTPLRLVLDPERFARRHYLVDDETTTPVAADWMLGALLLLRRSMLDEIGWFDERFRLYGEDIDLCYRAAQAGWERWYVPHAVAQHTHNAVTDQRFLTRRTLWHWGGIARFVRKHPGRLLHRDALSSRRP